jgi:hypothetical protein
MSEAKLRRLTVASAEYGIRSGRDDGSCRTVNLKWRVPKTRERRQARSWVDMIGGSWCEDFGCWTIFVLRGSAVVRRRERGKPRKSGGDLTLLP